MSTPDVLAVLELAPDDLGFSYRRCAVPSDWIFLSATLEGEPGRKHESLLGSGDRAVHAPLVHAEVDARDRADSVDEEQRRVGELVQKEQARLTELTAAKNIEEGTAFLAENAQKEGVVTLESGLQYEIITEGDGPRPTLEDQVKVHYKGTLIDGTEFDSSYQRGQPATFAVSGVIAGFTEALMFMGVGSHYRFFIPSDLAYGEAGRGGPIGPNTVLIFEMELLEIL